MAFLQNRKFEANSTVYFSVRWKATSGIVHELDDAVLQVRETTDHEDVLIEASTGNGYITIDPVTADPDTLLDTVGGWVNIAIPPAAMADLSYYGGAVYDLTVHRTSDGHWKRLLEGQVILSRGISRV